jgi:replicative DNA helicase
MIQRISDPEPPMDTAAEMCALASMMVCEDRVIFRQIRATLKPSHFTDIENASVYRTICAMDDDGIPIDSIAIHAELKRHGKLEEIGGQAYIARLLNAVPSWHHGAHYARIVAGLARDREAQKVSRDLEAALYQHAEPSSDLIQDAIGKLWALSTQGKELKAWSIGEAVERFVSDRLTGKRSVALDSGIGELDADYRGIFTFGGYTLVAARPSMGKSTFIRWLTLNLALAGTPCGLIAVEENEDKIAGNTLSSIANVENSHVAYGQWSRAQADAMLDAVASLKDTKLHGFDTAFSLGDVLAAAEMLIMQHGCKVVAVDHIHLITSPSRDNRNNQVNEISAALKNLFKRHGVVGIVAAQLNRPADKGVCPPPPRLTDLRDCGGLEEHADAALMLHRRDYYYRGQQNYIPDGLAELFVRKNRNGSVGQIVLAAELMYQRFKQVANGSGNYNCNDDPFA